MRRLINEVNNDGEAWRQRYSLCTRRYWRICACAESVITNLVVKYTDEGDEADDSTMDEGRIMAAISNEFVSNKVFYNLKRCIAWFN